MAQWSNKSIDDLWRDAAKLGTIPEMKAMRPEGETQDAVLRRWLGAFIDSSKGASHQRIGYFAMKCLQALFVALASVAGVLRWPVWVPGVIAALIVIFETVIQVFKFHENWLSYRRAANELRSEAWDFATVSGAYGTSGASGGTMPPAVDSNVAELDGLGYPLGGKWGQLGNAVSRIDTAESRRFLANAMANPAGRGDPQDQS